jgi:hypothetical protein
MMGLHESVHLNGNPRLDSRSGNFIYVEDARGKFIRLYYDMGRRRFFTDVKGPHGQTFEEIGIKPDTRFIVNRGLNKYIITLPFTKENYEDVYSKRVVIIPELAVTPALREALPEKDYLIVPTPLTRGLEHFGAGYEFPGDAYTTVAVPELVHVTFVHAYYGERPYKVALVTRDGNESRRKVIMETDTDNDMLWKDARIAEQLKKFL